jgi:hypothetical protein
MKFAFIPKGDYRIGQILEVQGRQCRVAEYSHTGKNVVVAPLTGRPERILCITTDAEPITEIKEDSNATL